MDSGYHMGYAHQPARPQPLCFTDYSNIRVSTGSNPSVYHEYFVTIDTLYSRQLVARLGI
jgi:hypothetical protein